jgi:hypothetical protein
MAALVAEADRVQLQVQAAVDTQEAVEHMVLPPQLLILVVVAEVILLVLLLMWPHLMETTKP